MNNYIWNRKPTESINCRCTLVMVETKPEQYELFSKHISATKNFEGIIKELKNEKSI